MYSSIICRFLPLKLKASVKLIRVPFSDYNFNCLYFFSFIRLVQLKGQCQYMYRVMVIDRGQKCFSVTLRSIQNRCQFNIWLGYQFKILFVVLRKQKRSWRKIQMLSPTIYRDWKQNQS